MQHVKFKSLFFLSLESVASFGEHVLNADVSWHNVMSSKSVNFTCYAHAWIKKMSEGIDREVSGIFVYQSTLAIFATHMIIRVVF